MFNAPLCLNGLDMLATDVTMHRRLLRFLSRTLGNLHGPLERVIQEALTSEIVRQKTEGSRSYGSQSLGLTASSSDNDWTGLPLFTLSKKLVISANLYMLLLEDYRESWLFTVALLYSKEF